jgi:7-cyano-7-deazaguanine synthase
MFSAEAVARHYGVTHYIRDLSEVFVFSNSPLLNRSSEAVPHGSYADAVTRDADGMSKTYVPYRNGLFLSYAAAIAYSLGAQEVFYGAHADDAAGNAYPDCSEHFYQAQADAIFLGTGQKVEMTAPLIRYFKSEIVGEGLKLNAPYHLTWSCYEGAEEACGECGTCVDRLNAFKANGASDPIKYATDVTPHEE